MPGPASGDSAVPKLLRYVASVFTYPRPMPPQSETRRGKTRRIVSMLSKGSVRLQRGAYATREDLDDRRARLVSRASPTG